MRRDQLEDEANADRWMVSYADFVTLLFAFFVVMYAISSVNDEKYRVLSATLAEAFDVDIAAASLDPMQTGEPSLAASPHIVDLPDSTALADQEEGNTFMEDPVAAAESLLGGFAELDGVSIESNNEWLEISLDAEVLFDAARTQLSDEARSLLESAVKLTLSNKNPITIEGYTDNVPVQSSIHPSNWEVSAARASAVARYFVEQGVRAERVSAVGYGENHPIATNATPDGRAANRRVVVVIARRAGGSRNLNADPGTSAFAVVRGAQAPEMDPSVVQMRTPEGGLRFTNESAEDSRADQPQIPEAGP